MKVLIFCFVASILVGCSNNTKEINDLKTRETQLIKHNNNLEKESHQLLEELQTVNKQLSKLQQKYKNIKLNAVSSDVKQAYLEQKEQINRIETDIIKFYNVIGQSIDSNNEAMYSPKLDKLNLSLKTILSTRYTADSLVYIKMLENDSKKLNEALIESNHDYNNQVYLKNSAFQSIQYSRDLLISRNKIWKDLFRNVSSNETGDLDLLQNLFHNITQDINPVGHYNGINEYRKKENYKGKRMFLDNYILYLWSYLKENPKYLKNLLSKEDKEYIFALFEGNSYYESSGLSLLIRGVLQSYKDMDHREGVMDSLYSISANNIRYSDLNYKMYISEDIKKIFANHQEDYGYSTAIYWAYSFWARRHKEGNVEFVYKLLNEFHERVYKGADVYEEIGC